MRQESHSTRSGMDVNYRAGEVGDVPAIFAMIQELAEFEKLSHEVVATVERLEETLFGTQPKAHVMVATVGPQVVAYALWFYTYSTFQARPGLYLEDLYVSPAFRRQGIGFSLLQKTAEVAVQQGCGRFEWSVLDWNSNAIHLYESFGATLMQDWRRMRLEGDALIQAAGPARE